MDEKAWAYYSSASDDEITHRENHSAYHRSVFILGPNLSRVLNSCSVGFGGALESCEM